MAGGVSDHHAGWGSCFPGHCIWVSAGVVLLLGHRLLRHSGTHIYSSITPVSVATAPCHLHLGLRLVMLLGKCVQAHFVQHLSEHAVSMCLLYLDVLGMHEHLV